MDRRFVLCIGLVLANFSSRNSSVLGGELPAEMVPILTGWEEAREEQTRSGFAVRSLQMVLGPMRVASLTHRFDWQLKAPNRIVATPVDATERQFLPQIEIELAADGQMALVRCGASEKRMIDMIRTEVAQVTARQNLAEGGIVQASFTDDKAPKASPPQWVRSWVAASAKTVAVRSRFRRTDYDDATAVEHHSAGTFLFSAPYDGLYHSQPAAAPETESRRTTASGDSFVQLPGDERFLQWRGSDLTHIDFSALTYSVLTRPATPREILGSGSFDMVWQTLAAPQSSLPLVAGLDANTVLKNYEWEVRGETTDRVTLFGTPVTGPDAMLYSSAEVILDRQTLRTVATRIVDAARSRETVHQFEYEIASTDPKALGRWEPDLTRFRQNSSEGITEGVTDDSPESPLGPTEPVSAE